MDFSEFQWQIYKESAYGRKGQGQSDQLTVGGAGAFEMVSSYSLLIQYDLYGNTNAHFGSWNVIILHAFTDVVINTSIYWFHMNT